MENDAYSVNAAHGNSISCSQTRVITQTFKARGEKLSVKTKYLGFGRFLVTRLVGYSSEGKRSGRKSIYPRWQKEGEISLATKWDRERKLVEPKGVCSAWRERAGVYSGRMLQ